MSRRPPPGESEFFIGWATRLPPGLGRFLPLLTMLVLALALVLGYGVARTQPDPGDGAFRWDLGQAALRGVVTAGPHPTLTLTEPGGPFATGQTVMLVGIGKTGVEDRAVPLDGRLAEARGVLLSRGALWMLQLEPGAAGLTALPGAASPVADVDLGRWRLTGEICDGKCAAGAMNPGTGLAHKACANLCLIGPVPPVLALTGAVEGQRHLMMAGPDGGPLGARLFDWTALIVTLEGRVSRRGDLLIVAVDPATVARP